MGTLANKSTKAKQNKNVEYMKTRHLNSRPVSSELSIKETLLIAKRTVVSRQRAQQHIFFPQSHTEYSLGTQESQVKR